MLEYFSFKRMI